MNVADGFGEVWRSAPLGFWAFSSVRRKRSRLLWRAPGIVSSSPSPGPSHPNSRERTEMMSGMRCFGPL